MNTIVFMQCYHVKDSRGDVQFDTCDETSDTIELHGLITEDEEEVSFESEAYHLREWCKEHGFQMRHQILEVEIEDPFDLER